MKQAFYLTESASVADNGQCQVLCKPRTYSLKVSTAVLLFCTLSGAALSNSEHVTNPRLSKPTAAYRANCPSPSPALREAFVGNSPLKLVVCRIWHDQKSFTDKLECGHLSALQFTEFTWETGKLVNLQPTAKRRRCKKCAAALTRSEGAYVVGLPQKDRMPLVGMQAGGEGGATEPRKPSTAAWDDIPARVKSGAQRRGTVGSQPDPHKLYADCLTETSLPSSPKKPCQSERDPARGKRTA